MARNIKIGIPNGNQKFAFINLIDSFEQSIKKEGEQIKAVLAEPIMYDSNAAKQVGVALLNRVSYISEDKLIIIRPEQGLGVLKAGDKNQSLDVFKQEIDADGNPLTVLEPVAKELQSYTFRDYNVSNYRRYRYVIYLSQKDSVQTTQDEPRSIYKTEFNIATNWQEWSITELHPADGTMKSFTVSPEDVWLFNLNISTGAQSQNITRNEIQTLGIYPRISQGKSNYIKGSVSCLLGKDVILLGEALKNGFDVQNGGYIEMRKYINTITSNQRVDMLKAWRKLVMSSNPKLLKDREGQSFLVAISDSTNQPMHAVKFQPNTISFNWTQIGTLDGVTIVGTEL